MQVRVLYFFMLCATASFVAFSLGMWVARGGAQQAQQKLGPSGDGQGIAHAKTVRVILPDTLDGQSIPGHGQGVSDRHRDLSPIYPTSPGSHEDRSITQLAGVAPSPRAQDGGDDANLLEASPLANDAGGSDERDDAAFRDIPADIDAPFPSDPRFLRHLPPGSRHIRSTYTHRRYLEARPVRSVYPFGAFARLSISDHGR
jgi:hypothetical protein